MSHQGSFTAAIASEQGWEAFMTRRPHLSSVAVIEVKMNQRECPGAIRALAEKTVRVMAVCNQ